MGNLELHYNLLTAGLQKEGGKKSLGAVSMNGGGR
jgi:hypothetical protein